MRLKVPVTHPSEEVQWPPHRPKLWEPESLVENRVTDKRVPSGSLHRAAVPGTPKSCAQLLVKERRISSSLGTVQLRRPEDCWRLNKVQKPRTMKDSGFLSS